MRSERALRLPRVPFGRAVGVTLEGDSQHALRLQAANLSLGGMFVYADESLPRGTRVSLALAAAGRLLDFAEGEVAWTHPSGFGVRFTNLPPRAQALVEHLVARGGTAATAALSSDPARARGRHGALAVAVVGVGVACVALFGLPPAETGPAHDRRPPPAAESTAPSFTAARPVDVAAHAYPGDFQVPLPTGAVTALQVTISDDEVAVTPQLRRGSTIQRVFKLPSPARLVIDVTGRQPRYSWQLDGAAVVKSVRVGARNHGTRVVVDLPGPLEMGHKNFRVIWPAAGGV